MSSNVSQVIVLPCLTLSAFRSDRASAGKPSPLAFNNLQPRIFAQGTVVNNSITIVLPVERCAIPHVTEMALF
jgi:hypothetical protein